MARTKKRRCEGTEIRPRSRYTAPADLNPSICPATNVPTSTLPAAGGNTDGAVSWPSQRERRTYWQNERAFIAFVHSVTPPPTLLVIHVPFLLSFLSFFFFSFLLYWNYTIATVDWEAIKGKWWSARAQRNGLKVRLLVGFTIQWTNVWNNDKVQKNSIPNKARSFLSLSLSLSLSHSLLFSRWLLFYLPKRNSERKMHGAFCNRIGRS